MDVVFVYFYYGRCVCVVMFGLFVVLFGWVVLVGC